MKSTEFLHTSNPGSSTHTYPTRLVNALMALTLIIQAPLQVLCQIDATDGQPSFDLGEVASQSEAQMAQILHSMSAHLNALDKQFHAENNDAVLEGVLEVCHALPSHIFVVNACQE